MFNLSNTICQYKKIYFIVLYMRQMALHDRVFHKLDFNLMSKFYATYNSFTQNFLSKGSTQQCYRPWASRCIVARQLNE